MDHKLPSPFLDVSVLIVGGGLVGALLANFLKQSKISFILVDPLTPKMMLDSVADGRTTAVSLGSYNIFKQCDLWSKKLEDYAQPIEAIRVVEKDSISVLDFDPSDLNEDRLGYVVENMYLRETLLNHLQSDDSCFYNTKIMNIKKHPSFVEATLSNDITVRASLLVSSEGRNSPTRDLIGPKKKSRDYAQNALVVHLNHEKPHQGRAWEVFCKNGPFAMLPLKDEADKKSGIVFAKHVTFDWNNYTDVQLENEVQKIFPYYGKVNVISKRWSFPLAVFELDKLVGHRQVLIGDAAHAMHPLAGQGVNLGWRDAFVLAQDIIKHHNLGLDIGQESYLKAYEKSRKKDIKMLVSMTDFMNELFQYDSKTVYYMRNLGLSLVNKIQPLKNILMKKAMGL